MSESEIVKAYYDADPALEWNRLERHYFEFEITKHYLKKYLSGKKILDIGGGPGQYSIWLAKEGFDVTLVDLSDGNIAFAKEKAEETGVNIRAVQADARDLSVLGDEIYDHVLLMGPLYHLFEEADRIRCVEEASAHLSKGGLLFASFIALHAGLNYYLSECPADIIQELTLAPEYLDHLAENKSWYGSAFTEAGFIHPDEIVPFFEACGYEKQVLFAQEGVTGVAEPEILDASEDVRALYLKLSLSLCEKPEYFAYTQHLMFIGKRSALDPE
ncbi:MAG: class I SAM-dependent methyltransferase [Lachnospiraceae bacterium]|nr:class I SAM-dependent methyltransferase [Lachnospiraceae bacterium]